MQQAFEVEHAGVVARHVGVAEHEIHVVDRVQAAEQTAEELQPARAQSGSLARRGTRDEIGDLRGIEFFARGRVGAGVAADAADQVAQFAGG